MSEDTIIMLKFEMQPPLILPFCAVGKEKALFLGDIVLWGGALPAFFVVCYSVIFHTTETRWIHSSSRRGPTH